MPRNPSGVYILPAGNPVVSDTLIESTWANSTLTDVGTAITGSLPRDGSAGMSAPLILYATTVSLPQEAVPLAQVQTGFLPKANPAATGDFTLTDTSPTAIIQASLVGDTSSLLITKNGSGLGGSAVVQNGGGVMTVGTSGAHATNVRSNGVDVITALAAIGVSSSVNIGGTKPRVVADFSDATVSNRTLFQTSVTNGATSSVGVITNGTGTSSDFTAYGGSNPDSAPFLRMNITDTVARLLSGKTGAAAYKPLALNVGGADVATYSEAAATLGNMTASVSRDSSLLHQITNTNTGATARATIAVTGDGTGQVQMYKNSVAGGGFGAVLNTGGAFYVGTTDANQLNIRTNNATALTLDVNGNVLAVKATGGLGYGVGAGGSVTQTTSKGTTVTLNRPNGRITMMADALAAGATITFTVNNSLQVSTYDHWTVMVPNYTGYRAKLTSGSVGTLVCSVTNETAGSLSEAVTLNFKLIKGSAT